MWDAIPPGIRKKCVYEPADGKLPYVLEMKYLPDIRLPNGTYVEIKGRLDSTDRRKMIAVKKAHPDLDIRFVFMRAHNLLYKGAKTTYAQWADKEGFVWSEGAIPESWYTE